MITLDVAITDNLRQVRERIANAAIKAGRKPADVTLVAVSKTKPLEAVKAALAAGHATGKDPLVAPRLLDRAQVFALEVFDQHHEVALRVVKLTED